MKYIIMLLFAISLYAQKSCYTVQLLSLKNSTSNLNTLEKEEYPTQCKIMQIGSSLTLRCGCYESIKEARVALDKLQAKYKAATIATTYSYRFADTKTAPVPKVIEETPPPKESFVVEEIPLHIDEEKQEKALVVVPIGSREATLRKENRTEKTKETKEKREKREKKKYVKKRAPSYKYERYLDKLKGKAGPKSLEYKYEFGLHIAYDSLYVDEADDAYNVNDWRRVRIYHKGSFLDEKILYELEYSFSGDEHYKDIYLGYEDSIRALDLHYTLKGGNIKIPFSLEGYSTSKNSMFMERGLNDAFAINRKLGLELELSQKLGHSYINLFLSGFANSIDERIEEAAEQSGLSTRATYAYKFRKNHLLSLGGAVMLQDIEGESLKYNQASEAKFIKDKYVSVKVKDVDSSLTKNIEALYIRDKYSLQAEYSSATIESLDGSYTFSGYYLSGSYFLLGEGRRYKLETSTLAKVKERGSALELALRYSYLNLNDKDEVGGEQSDYTIGVNWYLTRELKFMLNYVIAQPKGTDEYDGRLQLIQARALLAF